MLLACGSQPPPLTPRDEIEISAIQIDDVRISVLPGPSARVEASVRGVVGDGCAELLPPRQVRSGAEIALTIQRSRPKNAICTQIAKLYEETHRLNGEFPPGSYVLKVNERPYAFAVE